MCIRDRRDQNCVRVVVRVRPMNARESSNDSSITHVDEENDSLEIQTPVSQRSWNFDGCFGPETQQEEFFECCGVMDLVEAALDGYSACLLYTSPSPRDRTRSRMPSSA
eukprot:TRINITY_DN6156_c0_g1_i8.p1 TRINITY_DN6156_c0_g1~~TRINITY_DN6156_c0_g1_i8.p1  ORF type:complete len:118 (-),score=26.35 TRINITY_DN6156_c0_g1_i8:54-380(-)